MFDKSGFGYTIILGTLIDLSENETQSPAHRVGLLRLQEESMVAMMGSSEPENKSGNKEVSTHTKAVIAYIKQARKDFPFTEIHYPNPILEPPKPKQNALEYKVNPDISGTSKR